MNRQSCGLGLVAAVLASGLFVAGAQARVQVRKPGNQAKAKVAQNHQIIMELSQTKKLLESAKHDYDGHRAKAIHEITQAIHALHQHGTGTGGKATGNAGGGNKATGRPATGNAAAGENQQQSDVLLKQARQQLHVIHGQLGATHHAKAKTLVHAAIQQLDNALKIR